MTIRLESNVVRALGRAIQNGQSFDLPLGSINIQDLSNVTIDSPQDGDKLTYDATESEWINAS